MGDYTYALGEEREYRKMTALETGEYEDLKVEFDSNVECDSDVVFENCSVVFDIHRGDSLNVIKGKIRFIDCDIILSGCRNHQVIELREGSIEMENCHITQKRAKGEALPCLIKANGEGKIVVTDCTFDNIQGRIIQSLGTSVYIVNCRINDYIGEFCQISEDENDENNIKPSCCISDCSFENIKFCKTKYEDSGSLIGDDFNQGKVPYVIKIHKAIEPMINNLSFKHISIGCIRASENLHSGIEINKCKFEDCIDNGYKGSCSDDDAFCIYLTRIISQIDDCKFIKSRGVYAHAQYTKLDINNCVFDRCKITDRFRDGILYIFNEVDEQIINVSNCIFEKCVVEGKYDESENGIACIWAGMPEKKQEGSVIFSQCKFEDCKADTNIHGKEKQDGFFGRTIKFYREI